MAAYAQQLIIATGRPDWTSRIEEDGQGEAWGELARGLKKLLGRGGKYADPYNNILVTNSSFPSSPSSSSSSTASAFLFPSFKYFRSIPTNLPSEALDVASPTSLTTFVRAFLLPKTLHSMHGSVPSPQREQLTRSPDLASHFPATSIVHSPTILICGHGGRDMRCGVLGPVLQAEFQRVLHMKGYPSTELDGNEVDGPGHANVGLISHIGGHKYAGNVIIYIPPGLKVEGGEVSPLAGKGIWYGRIEPKHVEGIVDETVLKGRVVKDHFRGAIGQDGEVLRL
ncbi:hypothetical protein DTO271G3_3114 [Paecilomyces variotii]|nr:hypothetical protein DTO271G3_3114 [Paecilomyces variotii]